MAIVLTSKLRATMNAASFREADMAFARRIRAFRPERVSAINDTQLAEIVRRARTAARDLGIKNNTLVTRFVMVDALISPKFYEKEDLIAHFAQASGTADIKIGDMFQLIRVTMKAYGRSDEVWW